VKPDDKEIKTTKEKLQKLLAQAGYGSRREIEGWISEGLISINGHIAKLGDRASAQDLIRLRGQRLSPARLVPAQTEVLLYNKPEGEICTQRDPEGRPSVFRQLPEPHKGKWIVIGRLDLNTTGLLLFTTDGELANRLMHPSYQITREYAVRVRLMQGQVTDALIEQVRAGTLLEDKLAKFDDLTFEGGEGHNLWYKVTLTEGRYREVRRIWEAFGFQVSRLIRIKYAGLELPRNLRRGKHEMLDERTVNQLKSLVGLPAVWSTKTRMRVQNKLTGRSKPTAKTRLSSRAEPTATRSSSRTPSRPENEGQSARRTSSSALRPQSRGTHSRSTKKGSHS
jgi:23S rRNA pseudouridine2605 synthase